jgi:glycosyltransferase involved in cell wall biosynthesis
VLGNVANRNPSKGHEWLVRAAALVRAEEPSAVVRILGAKSPPHARYEEDFLREANELGLGSDEALRVVDPRDRVPELLPALDVFVLSSVPRSEGMPTVILEAMAAGLPVVATDVGAVAEIVEDGATGFVVPPEQPRAMADAILRLVRDRELRRTMGVEGQGRAFGRYGLETLAGIHAGAYRLALQHRATR